MNYLAGSKSVSARPPARPRYDDKYHSRHYRFDEWEQDAHQLGGQAKRHATKIRPKAVAGDIFGHFANFDKCRLEAAGDVTFGTAEDYVDMDVRATFGESA